MDELRPDDPRQVGRYRLLRRLGAGGMGGVFLGRTAGGRTVAVKLVRPEYAGDEEFRIRFRQEVAAGRRVGGRWTAPVLAGSVARIAVELLDLDSPAEDERTAGPEPAGPPHPPSHPPVAPVPPVAPGRVGRRGAVAAAVGATVAAIAAVAALLAPTVGGWFAHNSPTDHSTSTASGPAQASPQPVPEGAVPVSFLGTWRGEMTSALSSLKIDFRIAVAQGKAGEPVADIHNNNGAGTSYCDASALLVSAAPARLVLRTAPLSSLSGCTAVTAQQVYTVNADGSLHLQVDGFSGDLAKQP